MLESPQALDRTIFLTLNGMHTPYWDSFMYIFTSKFIWIPLYASILYVLYKNMNIRMVIFTTLMFALLITLADQTCSSILRPIFERPRPSRNPEIADLVHLVNGKRGGKFGFPSCHAANTFALACFIMLLFKNRALTTFFMLWAIVTCYTRIYVGVHYPGDLLFGT
ncbi:MAG TPA: phosphatase PAP2 family protein, partial [Candidatus Butyricimonas faecavium]|nr:phosphatase PAP2 family protein [Candidatus Butyricimonas faecavium]